MECVFAYGSYSKMVDFFLTVGLFLMGQGSSLECKSVRVMILIHFAPILSWQPQAKSMQSCYVNLVVVVTRAIIVLLYRSPVRIVW
mgnify:CR=1 FL=1